MAHTLAGVQLVRHTRLVVGTADRLPLSNPRHDCSAPPRPIVLLTHRLFPLGVYPRTAVSNARIGTQPRRQIVTEAF
jgi:hypothetical protein|eukprot:COSAG06_NODE_1092_length_10744_cov_67.135181_2_plen_77_part_00